MKDFKYKRCVHLDYHTSEFIGSIADKFDAEEFAETALKANVQSMTVFAKCHHGWTYYPSKFGAMHPGLKIDLLQAQVDALHKRGMLAPVYYPIGWSHQDSIVYPECIYRGKDGSIKMEAGEWNGDPDAPRPNASWVTMCQSGRYKENIYNQVEELCQKLQTLDGFFFDISHSSPKCHCPNCLKDMYEKGIDLRDDTALDRYTVNRYREFERHIREIIAKYHPDASVYFNTSGSYLLTDFHEFCTHFEMEDLPSIQGGYNKLPLASQYFETTDKDYMGMTGKFYTMWGEFGGIKSAPTLKIEAKQMLTYGSGMSIGDSLHPNGKLDKSTYEIIGETFEYYKSLEEYCLGKDQTANIAIMPSYFTDSDEGVVKILLENQIDFRIIKRTDEIKNIDCLILPSRVKYDKDLADRITAFVDNGGKLLVLGDAMLKPETCEFGIDLGLKCYGESPFDCDYPKPDLKGLYSESPILMYESGMRVKATDGESLGKVYEPYFSRTNGRWCNHMNTPNRDTPSEYDCGVKRGNTVYIAHDIGRLYNLKGAQLHKDWFMLALRLIYNGEIVKTTLGTGGRVHLVKDTKSNYYTFNVMYFMSTKRGECEVVEDIYTFNDKPAELTITEPVKSVYCVQQNKQIPFTQNGNKLSFNYDIIDGHSTIIINY